MVKVEKFSEVIHGDLIEFTYTDEPMMAEDIYVDHGNDYYTEGDTFRGVDTYYLCYCGCYKATRDSWCDCGDA